MTKKQLSIFIENKEGTLIKVLELLSKAGIQIIASTIADTKDYGIYRVICDKPEDAYLILKEAGINLEYAYSLIGTNNLGGGVMIFEVNDTSKAVDVLNKEGIKVISQEELYAL